MGLLECNGKVRAKVTANATQETLHGEVRGHVEEGAHLFTDGWRGYNGLHTNYVHKVIDHAEKYVDGQIHTNGIENFWSLLKRGIKGTYVPLNPFTCSAILMSNHSDSTRAKIMMLRDSFRR